MRSNVCSPSLELKKSFWKIHHFVAEPSIFLFFKCSDGASSKYMYVNLVTI